MDSWIKSFQIIPLMMKIKGGIGDTSIYYTLLFIWYMFFFWSFYLDKSFILIQIKRDIFKALIIYPYMRTIYVQPNKQYHFFHFFDPTNRKVKKLSIQTIHIFKK
jgi:hypothetical protein